MYNKQKHYKLYWLWDDDFTDFSFWWIEKSCTCTDTQVHREHYLSCAFQFTYGICNFKSFEIMKLYIKTFEAKSYLRGLETTNAVLTRSLQVVMSPATQKIWKANIIPNMSNCNWNGCIKLILHISKDDKSKHAV